MKENLIFYYSTLFKCNYDELKLMLGLQIRIRLDLDFFDRIQILQGAMGEFTVRPFMLALQLVSELWQISRIWDPWFYIYGGTAQRTVVLKRPIFKWKKGFANHSLGLIFLFFHIPSTEPPHPLNWTTTSPQLSHHIPHHVVAQSETWWLSCVDVEA
jgi:hypothetical protein